MRLTRRALLALPVVAAGCEPGRPLRVDFPPLRYDYLVKLRLNVGQVVFAPLPPPGPLDDQNPAPPGPVLLQMGRDRLEASGSLGQATFTVEEALITQAGDGLAGSMAVRVEVQTSQGRAGGFAEARVTRRLVGLDDLRGSLYDITKQMMDDMNVEFEFQMKQSLRDWLQEAETAPPPPSVEQQPLGAPGVRPVP